MMRTLRYAAEQSASRGGDATDAKALMRRWCHEIQLAIMRRRAAMVRSVRPTEGRTAAHWAQTSRRAGLVAKDEEPPGEYSYGDDETDDGNASLDEGMMS